MSESNLPESHYETEGARLPLVGRFANDIEFNPDSETSLPIIREGPFAQVRTVSISQPTRKSTHDDVFARLYRSEIDNLDNEKDTISEVAARLLVAARKQLR